MVSYISTAFIITLKVFSEQSQTNPLGILLMGLYGRTRIEGGEGTGEKGGTGQNVRPLGVPTINKILPDLAG